jgi:hypothetical protein
VIGGSVAGLLVLLVVILLLACWCCCRERMKSWASTLKLPTVARSKRKKKTENPNDIETEKKKKKQGIDRTAAMPEILQNVRSKIVRNLQFTYEELKAATNGFAEENKLGEGGFGFVFRGQIDISKLNNSHGKVSRCHSHHPRF